MPGVSHPTICVVHLVREANGIECFRNFLASYRRFDSGLSHDFCILLKGFASGESAKPYFDALASTTFIRQSVNDTGLDMTAYLEVARRLRHDWLCFLNSFSVILSDGWLAKLAHVFQQQQVGIVGATGSAESTYTGSLKHLRSVGKQIVSPAYWRSKRNGRFFDPLFVAVEYARAARQAYAAFPNYHLRSNGFLIQRELLLQVGGDLNIVTKLDAERFESGRSGLTRSILKMGLRPLVVGKDGNGYEMPNWSRSGTFRQSNQENLLIADNRTRQYESADLSQREILKKMAWGK